jgi:hypothetical protein
VRKTGTKSHEQPEPEFLWCGCRVKVFDGSSLTMADTPKNQAKYPQPTSPALGCGFPAGRIVCGFSLSTGVVLDAIISSIAVREVNLSRQLYVHLQASSVALGDRISELLLIFVSFLRVVSIVLFECIQQERPTSAVANDFCYGTTLSSGLSQSNAPKGSRKSSLTNFPNGFCCGKSASISRKKASGLKM